MWLEDLRTILEGDAVATWGVDLFMNSRAAVPQLVGSATVTITETPGTAPELTQNSTIRPAYLQPAAQILARANTYGLARAKADAAYFSLAKIRNQFIDCTWYQHIKPLHEPADMGSDEKGQSCVVFNVIGKKRSAPSTVPDWLAFLLANNASELLIGQVRLLFASVPGLKVQFFSDVSSDSGIPTAILGPCTIYGGVVMMGLIDGVLVEDVVFVMDTNVAAVFQSESKTTGQQSIATLPDGLLVTFVQAWYNALDGIGDPTFPTDPVNSPTGFVLYV